MRRILTPAQRYQMMSRIKSRGNERTELRLLQILRRYKISGWRRHQTLPGRPDFAFRREHVAVFIDGCFWHKCPTHCRQPRSNSGYWLPKLQQNQLRDRRVNRALHSTGWKVLRFWEHELQTESRVVIRLVGALGRKSFSTTDRKK